MATVNIEISAYVGPLSITLNYFTGGCFGFTTSGPAQETLTMQISTDNGVTWSDSSGSFFSPRCGFEEPTVTSKYRIKSTNEPIVYSNILERVIEETAYAHSIYDGSNQPGEQATCTDYNFAPNILYSLDSVLVVGSVLYYESTFTTIYNGVGFNHYYPTTGKLLTISSAGIITAIGDCVVSSAAGTYTLSAAPYGGCSVTYYDVTNNLATETIPSQDEGLSFSINVGDGGIVSDSCGFYQ